MDLVPLDVVGDRLQDEVLLSINSYIKNGDFNDLWNAFDVFIKEIHWDIYTAIIEVSKQYEDGARKYAEDNWKKGMPVHCFVDSAARHYMKFKRGDADEPHDRAFLWNIVSGIWMHIYKPEYIDLPFATKHEMQTKEEPTEICHWVKVKNFQIKNYRAFDPECVSPVYVLTEKEIDAPRCCPYCGKKVEISNE